MFRGNGRLVILCEPSGVGKSPLAKALAKFHPECSKRLQGMVLYNSRSPRPGEPDDRDYHFRKRSQIEAFRPDNRYALLACAAICRHSISKSCGPCLVAAM